MTATSVAPARDVQLRIRGLQIHAQVRGEGEPLLLHSGVWGEVRLWERLLPHLSGIDAAHVLGASFGGAIAQEMAFSHPRRGRGCTR
jgi:pimeloyl-ACP methyl ester carboxylesterase